MIWIHQIIPLVRSLMRSRRFVLPVIGLQALGIGICTVFFASLYAVLLKPLPYPNSHQLVRVYDTYTQLQLYKAPALPREYRTLRGLDRVFNNLGASVFQDVHVLRNDEAESQPCLRTTASLLATLEIHPALGRGLDPQGDREGGPREVLLSHAYWKQNYASSPSALGQSLMIDGQAHTIVGVLPRGLDYRETSHAPKAAFWASLSISAMDWESYGGNLLNTLGRLRGDVPPDLAHQILKNESAHLAQTQPGYSGLGFIWELSDLKESLVGDRRSLFHLLVGVVGLVFLIACTNTASLLITRAASRRKEISLRAALGASRGELIKQSFLESLILALMAGFLGLLLAGGALGLIKAMGSQVPRLSEATLGLPVIGFAFFASLLSCLLSGILPALQTRKFNLERALREDGQGSGSLGLRTRRTLVMAEITMALLALVNAGLIGKSVYTTLNTPPGGRIEEVCKVSLTYPMNLIQEPERLKARQRNLLEQLAHTPGIQYAAFSSQLLLSGEDASSRFGIEGWMDAGKHPRADFRYVTAQYPETLGMTLLKGRFFRDDETGRVTLINESLAKRYFPGQNPVGQKLLWPRPIEIIGVVSDLKNRGLESPTFPEFLIPFHQASPQTQFHALFRGQGTMNALGSMAVKSMRQGDPGLAFSKLGALSEPLKESLEPRRFSALMLGSLGTLALVMAGGGLYSLLSLLVWLRRRELAIRSMLGADPKRLVILITQEGLLLASLGIGLGLLLLPLTSQATQSLLMGTMPGDPWILLGSCLLLLTVALLACVFPSMRAARSKPLIAMGSE